MFLDRQLCIRKFTPQIAETFRVIPQDIGRPVRTFTHDLSYPTLIGDLERVLQVVRRRTVEQHVAEPAADATPTDAGGPGAPAATGGPERAGPSNAPASAGT